MSAPLYGIYGASGCGRGILPVARELLMVQGIPARRLVFIDDAPQSTSVNGHAVMTFDSFCAAPAPSRHCALAIADSKIRHKLSDLIADRGIEPMTVTAANAVIMDDVHIGPGALLSPFVTLTSNIRIGRYFHANLYSYVEHDCLIGNFVTFAPSVKCNGNVVIEDHVYVGAGAVIKQGQPGKPLVIGKGAVIGMGAVVTKSVAAGATVVGIPARPVAGA